MLPLSGDKGVAGVDSSSQHPSAAASVSQSKGKTEPPAELLRSQRSFIFVPKPLSKEAINIFTWKQLRGPVAVTFACMLGMCLALADEYYFKDTPFHLSAAGVMGTTLMLMDMSTSEKFYVQTFFRIVATIGGIGLGMTLAYAESFISQSYKGDQKALHDDDWKLILYRSSTLIPLVFICTLMMKLLPKYSYPFVVFAVQTPAALFAADVKEAVGLGLSALCAVLVAIIAIVTFENFTTDSLLMDTNNRAIQGVLAIAQFALRGDNSSDFQSNTETVHKSINSAESSITTYSQWRKITCRSVTHDYGLLIKPMKPLFYQAYSLYWGNVDSFRASEYFSQYLFCDTKEQFVEYFKPLVDGIHKAIDGIREELGEFYSHMYHDDEEVIAMLERIIDMYLWNGLCLIQENLKANYLEYRDECYSTFAQRWNMTDYLREFAMITLALVEYLRAISSLFISSENGDKQAIIFMRLDELSEALDNLRREETVQRSIKSRATSFSAGPSSPKNDSPPPPPPQGGGDGVASIRNRQNNRPSVVSFQSVEQPVESSLAASRSQLSPKPIIRSSTKFGL